MSIASRLGLSPFLCDIPPPSSVRVKQTYDMEVIHANETIHSIVNDLLALNY